MTPDQWFVVASQVAVTGWILLAVGLFLPRTWAGRVLFFGGRVVPLVLCLAYLIAILRWLSLPCLAATLMFGPAGLLLFLLVSRVGGQLAPYRKAVP